MLGIWLIVNLLQATFTELFHDEAYYWMYSRVPDWGYYDHAPMIAWMIRLGYGILPHEIGVRLLTVLMSTGTIYLLYQILQPKDPKLIWGILLSVALVHVGGFFAAPDSPMIFFGTLFLYRYQRYLQAETPLTIGLLILSIVLLLYSKYHGIMLIFFTVVSHPKLLLKGSFWLAAFASLLLFMPHLVWLHEHDYASLTFHLLERTRTPWHIGMTLNFIGGQLLGLGPLVSLILLWGAFRHQVQNQFERSLKYCVIGIMGLLLLMSFKNNIEANWAASAYIPIMILAYLYLKDSVQWQKWLYRLAVPSMLIFIILRCYLVVDFIPQLKQIRPEFHGWDDWAEQIKDFADGRPVIFANSYQRASKYAFYSGGEVSHSANNYFYRKNQYDLWPIEEALQGKPVLYLASFAMPYQKLIYPANGDSLAYSFIDSWRSYNKMDIEIDQEELVFPADSLITVPVTMVNPYSYPINLSNIPDTKVYMTYHIFKDGEQIKSEYIKPYLKQVSFEDQYQTTAYFRTPAEPGEYQLLLSLTYGWLHPGFNGRYRKLIVE